MSYRRTLEEEVNDVVKEFIDLLFKLKMEIISRIFHHLYEKVEDFTSVNTVLLDKCMEGIEMIMKRADEATLEIINKAVHSDDNEEAIRIIRGTVAKFRLIENILIQRINNST